MLNRNKYCHGDTKDEVEEIKAGVKKIEEAQKKDDEGRVVAQL